MRLIDADALTEEIRFTENCLARGDKAGEWAKGYRCGLESMFSTIEDQPTIEAEPVVHGRWIPHNKGQNNWCECSKCNTVGSPFWKRCPVCEAKMDGERKNNE